MTTIDSRRGRAARALIIAFLVLLGCGKKEGTRASKLSLEAPLPASFPRETRLTLGDPQIERRLALGGELDSLPFTATFEQLSGGPQTIEAFRAGALDGGSVGDTPPIHAIFTGLDVKIIAVQVRTKPQMKLATAPASTIRDIADLRGKRIAYSPGQAQGALVQRVLRKAGIAQDAVTLIELSSPEFKDALSSRQVDAAPLGGPILLRYLREYQGEGAQAIDHGVRDSLSFFYVRTDVLEDPSKAAALREYVKLRTRAQLWSYDHPKEWVDGYYVANQGLSAEEGRHIVESIGRPVYPGDWSEAIALTQETIDLLAKASGKPRFDAARLFDRRFETVAAEAAAAVDTVGRTALNERGTRP